MRLLLALPLGLIIGLALGALGGGGSILAVPALVYVVGLGPEEAVATSLVVVGVAALGGMVGHWRAGRVRVAAGLWFGLAGVLGSLLGTRLSQTVNPDVLLLAFAGVMLLVAWRLWAAARAPGRGRSGASSDSNGPAGAAVGGSAPAGTPPPGRGSGSQVSTVGKVVAAGTAVGFMTGFFGVGGGFIIVPALVLALRFEMPVAIGTSLLVIFLNCGEALASRLATTGVEWHVALPFAGAAVEGSAPAGTPPPGRRIGSQVSTVAKVVAAGTAVGFMTGFFGVGGGFIIVPALVLALRFEMPVAIGTSLLVIFLNCGEALASRLATTGVEWHVALPFAGAALIGAVAGNHMASRVRSSTLQRWFAMLLVAVAIYTLARSAVAL